MSIEGIGSVITPRQSKTPKTPKTPSSAADRFIPCTDVSNDVQSMLLLGQSIENAPHGNEVPGSQLQNAMLAESLLKTNAENAKILAFKAKPPKPRDGTDRLRTMYTQNRELIGHPKRKFRSIPTTPERVLDAPGLVDDFYLNVLDWSAASILAVALGPSVYLWNANSGTISMLCESKEEDNIVTSLRWCPEDSSILSVGMTNAEVQLWNTAQQKQIRSMKGHASRVSTLSWNHHILSSGARDTFIFHHDVRNRSHHVATLSGHTQEICGLTWSPDGSQLASGSNDNTALVWSLESTTPLHELPHQAAVKALAWAPFQARLLATGAGTADRKIRFWNTSSFSLLNQIDTSSQLCALVWARNDKEIVSAHGFSQNQICLWKYPSLALGANLTGHTSRILHLALSPDGSTVCSAAGDETLRFWRVFETESKRIIGLGINSASAAGGSKGSPGHVSTALIR